MMMVSVRLALSVFGSRKAVTPLLTASTPVMAVHPLAKTFINSQSVSTPVAGGNAGGATTGIGCPPVRIACKEPRPMTVSRQRINTQVGIMKTTPVSRTPRMFTTVNSRSIRRQSPRVWACRLGTAETSAPTPAEMPTAAVRT